MIGCIITGHGEFSIGLKHAIEMIAGEQENLKALPFYEQDSLEVYQSNLKHAIDELTKETSDLVVLTDLMGGTPFNTAMLLKNGQDTIQVLAGANLPMLLELVVQRLSGNDKGIVVDQLIHTAQKGVVVGKLEVSEDLEEVEGI